MYAVAFDLDTNILRETLKMGDNYSACYQQIRNFLTAKGFTHTQGNLYLGGERITAANCPIIVAELAGMYEWFPIAVKDIRMLRIEENNDLSEAVAFGSQQRQDRYSL